MEILLITLILGCFFLGILTVLNTIRLICLKRTTRRKVYYTSRLSQLHGKEFKKYMDSLIKNL